jgi:hypothetical protein
VDLLKQMSKLLCILPALHHRIARRLAQLAQPLLGCNVDPER